MNSFVFFFVFHEATRYVRYQTYRQHKHYTMETKIKLYLEIILLNYYVLDKNLFVNVDWSPLKHVVSQQKE